MQNGTNEKKSPGVSSGSAALVRVAVVIGIAILINVFLAYLVRVFYLEPTYTDFCPESQVVKPVPDQEACLSIGGQWNESGTSGPVLEGRGSGSAYCNEQFTCSKDFEKANSLYNRNLFIVFVIAGAALLFGSPFLAAARTVSSGLSLGGVIALIFGSLRYWSDMDDRLRVVVSGAALLALLAIAWRRFKDE